MPKPKITTPPRGLTVPFIESLKPGADRYEVTDAAAVGLRLRVYPNPADGKRGDAVKSFRWAVKEKGATSIRWITIGPWSARPQPGHVTLEQAHHWLKRLKDAHKGGTLPTVEVELREFLRRGEERQKVADLAPGQTSVEALCEDFFKTKIEGKVTRPEKIRQVLDSDIIKTIGSYPIASIDVDPANPHNQTQRDAARALLGRPVHEAVKRKATVHAGFVLQTLKRITRYGVNKTVTPESPGRLLVDLGATLDPDDLGVEDHASRERFMGDEELKVFLETIEPPTRPQRKKLKTSEEVLFALGILLRVGERPIGLLKAEWKDIDLKAKVWRQPPSRQSKKKKKERASGQPWEVPLSAQTVVLLKKLRALTGKKSEKVFPLTDKVLNRALTRLQQPRKRNPDPVLALDKDLGPICVYDLRRSCRSGLERLGVPYEVCEKILNHRVRGRVAATYARDPLLAQRREAAQRWADHLDAIRKPSEAGGKVIDLKARRA